MEMDIILETKGITKTFGPTVALKNVSISIRSGEIRGLIGENGSGKSTLTSIIAGMQEADSGEMYYLGNAYNPKSMIEGQKNGISMILQEAGTISNISVAQNIFLGNERKFTKLGIVNRKQMIKEAQSRIDSFEISSIKASDRINTYGFEDRKLLEIVRVVNDDTEILIVDETTTALSHEGRELLYKLIRKMASEGKAVIFISHDLDELLEVCDVLTVLRDGEIVGELSKEEMNVSIIRKMMVGRDIGDKYYRTDYNGSFGDEVTLSLNNVSYGPLKNFNIELHKGEILGIGGLSGSGMHDVGRIAFGIDKPMYGTVNSLKGKVLNSRKAIQHGMAYISKDRDTDALILQGSVKDNLVLPSLPYLEKIFLISPFKEKKLVMEEIKKLSIKTNHMSQDVNQLSGGNKQKVSFGKWTAMNSQVLIMDCPTRGVDIGVKQAMYQLIETMKKEGKSILLISEELSELIGMCDRIAIMKDFEVKKEFIRSAELSDSDIIEYMI
ncbi:ribose transport system ATP-binding protein [[Clostridium] fimetarium]|uniref:Ribose transport system ATP-binding protein n=2 Tax=[Clostridium] fimetarium TaxID=99656 RepID=A0A1I0NE11_9FIRM|nr:ribose transport system ATP-binding protein [[Clostridium] fimetarium]